MSTSDAETSSSSSSKRKPSGSRKRRREDGPAWSRSDVACAVCRKAKTRCDDFRPCSRCVRLGRQCVDSFDCDANSHVHTAEQSEEAAAPAAAAASVDEADLLLNDENQSTAKTSSPTFEELFIIDGVAYPSEQQFEPQQQQWQQRQQQQSAQDILDELLEQIMRSKTDEEGDSSSKNSNAQKDDNAEFSEKDELIQQLRTEVKLAHSKIAKLQRKIRRIEEDSQDYFTDGYDPVETPVMIVGQFGRVISMNEALRKRLLMDVSEYTDENFVVVQLVDPSFRPTMLKEITRFWAAALNGEYHERLKIFARIRRPLDGKVFKVLLEMIPVYDKAIDFILMGRGIVHFLDEQTRLASSKSIGQAWDNSLLISETSRKEGSESHDERKSKSPSASFIFTRKLM